MEEGTPDECFKISRNKTLTSVQKQQQVATAGATGASAISNIISAFFSKCSPNSAFSLINQIQMILLLLLFGVYLPEQVKKYIQSLTMALFDFDIDWSFFIVFDKIDEWFNYKQPSDELYMSGISSGSTLINLSSLVTMAIIFSSLHLILLLLNLRFKEVDEPTILMKVVRYFRKSFSSGIYIRLVIESFITICLASFSEIYRAITKSSMHIGSFISAIIFASISMAFLIFLY